MELKEITKIFIIESPSEADIEQDRKEGLALSEILRLSNIKNAHYNANSVDVFKATLKKISSEIKLNIKSYGAITLHFSMHGNQDGIGLTNGEFIDWNSLYLILKDFNDTIGYISLPSGKKLAPVSLNFSVCKGFYAIAIKNMGEESTYHSLVAPTVAVDWADSIMAFATFYHNTLHKTKGSKIAVEKMNSINDLDNIFRIDLMDELTQI